MHATAPYQGIIPARLPSLAMGRFEPVSLRFHGQAGEYFKIWIVNLLLSVLTLGIYSAWAKVRTMRYFHGSTELAGARFDYHATPISILIGRAIAFGMFVPVSLLSNSHPGIAFGLLLLVMLVAPYLVIRSLRFRLRMVSYRNIRFGFDGSVGQGYLYFLLMPILSLLSMGLATPYVQHEVRRFVVDHSRFGATRFQMRSVVGDWYVAYLYLLVGITGMVIALMVLGAIVMGLIGALFLSGDSDWSKTLSGGLAITAGVVGYGAFLLVYVVSGQMLRAWLNKLVLDNSRLGEVRFKSNMRVMPLFKLYALNTLAIVFSLGLAYPWARVRLARYMAETTDVLAPFDLSMFVAGEQQQTNAIGEEIADMFQVDIGI
ncbi:YjgN family protein [Chitinimonas lacunae]|uniref:YjgN family protein n=1 Tax=Chitinimonas lacunae TaxID=1963018 RepID=A0ABV8MQR8_9NEIS